MNLPTAFFLSLLLGSAAYAAGRVHAGVGYRFGYRFGYRQGYFDGDRASWNRRRREEQLAISAALRDRPPVDRAGADHAETELLAAVPTPAVPVPAGTAPAAPVPAGTAPAVVPVDLAEAVTGRPVRDGDQGAGTAAGRVSGGTPAGRVTGRAGAGADRVPLDRVTLDRVALDRNTRERGSLDPLVVGERPVPAGTGTVKAAEVPAPDAPAPAADAGTEVAPDTLALAGRGRTYGRPMSTGRHAQADAGTG